MQKRVLGLVLLLMPGCAPVNDHDHQADAINDNCPETFLENAALKPDCQLLQNGLIETSSSGAVGYEIYRVFFKDYDDPESLYDREPYWRTGVILVDAQSGERIWSKITELGLSWFEKPESFVNDDGEFVVAREIYTGTGGHVDDHVFLWRTGQWRLIASQYDTDRGEGFLKALNQSLPEGKSIRKGVFVDYDKLSGETPVYNEMDPEAAPTGGRLYFTLVLNHDYTAFQIDAVKYEPEITE